MVYEPKTLQRLIDNSYGSGIEPQNASPAQISAATEVWWVGVLAARGLPPDWTEEDLRRQGYDLYATRPRRVEQGHYDSDGHYRPGEDEEARTPRAAWTAAQVL